MHFITFFIGLVGLAAIGLGARTGHDKDTYIEKRDPMTDREKQLVSTQCEMELLDSIS